ncbi:chemotaxis protein CheX [Halanaerobium congolense]|jgi:chemotaxis protein CheX|uniref:Chemotaxis protein CheX n=1 Tax=Halanaerobium congolense TaxID=54121 RepID=A0A1G8M0S6_9FIRM|nr:chemotaxis protein CheX [Halanaerobium congolense]KXS49919.1 MAG: chemotaxis protein CheX [Halanaerobium sp. T82-1]PUU86663.1 MAG: chemotaxis protein CheX [Halanaerobium sp.]TDX41792.1 chemotaxis protein CheX [Halanaerobium congolense]SDI61564.1 chemotaxis protein CheX [Halanaerobium congolense]SET34334.1 chemotaxis protein CheX [Halanaerobium congolense]
MDVKYLNPIIAATDSVFETMLSLKPEKGKMSVQEELITDKEANVIIGMTGDIRGSIVYSFSEEMALKVVAAMSGMEMDTLDKFVTSAMGELGNIISGKATVGLSEQDLECDIVPPQIVTGKEINITSEADSVLMVNFNTELGDFDVSFAIK